MSRRRLIDETVQPGQFVRAAGQGEAPPGHFPGTRFASLVVEDTASHWLMRFEMDYEGREAGVLRDRRSELHPNVDYRIEDRDGEAHTYYLTCLSCSAAGKAPLRGWSITADRVTGQLTALCRGVPTGRHAENRSANRAD